MDFKNNCVKCNEGTLNSMGLPGRPILSAVKCSAWTLVSDDIRFMRIFAEVLTFLYKFSLELRMSRYAVLVIIQIAVLK